MKLPFYRRGSSKPFFWLRDDDDQEFPRFPRWTSRSEQLEKGETIVSGEVPCGPRRKRSQCAGSRCGSVLTVARRYGGGHDNLQPR